MNKKTILGLLTGAAIVAATTGSYAAWDNLEATGKVTNVKFRKPVTVTADLNLVDASDGLSTPEYSGSISLKATDVPASVTNAEWTLTPSVKDGAGSPVNDVTVTITGTDADGKIAATTPGPQNIDVKVTPTESAAANDLSAKELTVEIKAVLSGSTTTPAE